MKVKVKSIQYQDQMKGNQYLSIVNVFVIYVFLQMLRL